MRKRRVWLTFALVFIASPFFYVSVVHHQQTDPSVASTAPDKHVLFVNASREIKSPSCPVGNLVYENYCAISNFRNADKNRENNSLVTLCTQGTVEFLHHVVVLCNRWGGPISVAVYSPADDFQEARNMVDDLRRCDFCVRQWVSWHFFYQKDYVPNISVSTSSFGNCSALSSGTRTTKRKSKGTYPINVGRNIARFKTHTPYVFSIDIELYPSQGVLPKFERMIRSSKVTKDPQVWVLPVFEVKLHNRAPTTKNHLRTMFLMKQVISFHKYKCDICHRIPNLPQWMNAEAQWKSELNESMEALKVWTTVKRSRAYRLQEWEPFFIGTRNDPEFDPRLSWEGKQNKMQMAYEMCLRRYDFHIVENAFLVHAPGITVYNRTKEQYRFKHQTKNNKWIAVIKRDLKKNYGLRKDC